jgi:hypothetical protein
MTDIDLPIFVGEGHDLTSFDVLMDAEHHLEAIDVRAGIYKGFDAQGRRLRIEADERDRTHITLAEPSPSGASELKDALEYLLRHLGELPEPPPGGHSLSFLVERADPLLRLPDPGPLTRLLGYGTVAAVLGYLSAAFAQLIWEGAALWQRLAVGVVVAATTVAALVIVVRARKEHRRGRREIR